MTLHDRNPITLLSGLLVVLGTLATLVVQPPPPQLSANAATWMTYLHAHQTGVVASSLAASIVALALIGLAWQLPGPTPGILPSLAVLWAVATLAGASAQAFLAQQSQRLGGHAVLALLGLTRALLYVVPALAASVFLAAATAGAAAWWRTITVLAAAAVGAAGVWTLLSTGAAAAGAGFAARLLFTLWAGAAGAQAWRRQPRLASGTQGTPAEAAPAHPALTGPAPAQT